MMTIIVYYDDCNIGLFIFSHQLMIAVITVTNCAAAVA